MINVNLLPESMRKKEGLPRSQFALLLLLVAVLGALVYATTRYAFVTIPALEQEERSLAQTEQALQSVVRELAELDREIARMSGYIDAVKGLYRQRTVWAKVLADIREIVNFDPRMAEYNPEQRYLWLTTLDGRGKSLTLAGFATAANEVVAMQMPERFLQGFRDYSRGALPERDEAAALEEELRRTPAGEREAAIRARLEELAAAKSGGIALRPFVDMLVPGSLQLTNASWTNAPRPAQSARDAVPGTVFPEKAWNFTITMDMR